MSAVIFKMNEPIFLEPMPNGGWVVRGGSTVPGALGRDIGAYSSAADMLDDLKCLADFDATTPTGAGRADG
jgi:hypothetical protein